MTANYQQMIISEQVCFFCIEPGGTNDRCMTCKVQHENAHEINYRGKCVPCPPQEVNEFIKQLETNNKYEMQQSFCVKTGSPMFAGDKCFSCGGDFWAKVSVREATTQIISGCRLCNKSFVE
jgi:hypothetical protein